MRQRPDRSHVTRRHQWLQRFAMVALASTLAACAQSAVVEPRTESLSDCATLLHERLGADAAQLCGCQGLACTTPVVITDFVAVDDYRSQRLGKRLGEEFRLAWQQRCQRPVRTVELAADFRLDETGLRALTRDVAQLMTTTTADPLAFVGTYRLEGTERIRYFIRQVHLPTQTTTTMAGGYLPRRCIDPLTPLPSRLTQ
ncbi:FlgO family outer membrane protein [Hydrogenophilus thermoluteolus]|uniref:FlgO domain-containing protein n=1 Tax=Hydrogenophilus thermoluteolus TaxID=297 RepID=A0A2Z6DYJ4_HYDTE|nr:FlgO family outer membrane protein [Hydrogenophilus thermoluteolus]BBD77591.1 hypothetical protein HPTL_1327 [Hydrogenophilus thermoluteolus]GLW59844.1 hypothetical protein Hthe01_01930 [Hydrogenophilus thermoluteolus]